VSSYAPHFGEEDCLRGSRGSGTIFFTQCNLHCVFCQNYEISHTETGIEVRPEQLARMMLELQLMGCHNINLVTPSHVVPQVLEALVVAVADGLRLSIVYNTGSYDSVESLRLLEGLVDIYMPDFKCWEPTTAALLLHRTDYPDVARSAIREMHRQVGDLVLDENGIAVRGLLVRHLVMPGQDAETAQILRFLATDLSRDTFVNIMDQYRPAGAVDHRHFPTIDRRPTHEEIRGAYHQAREVGLHRFDHEFPRIF
jgi:putative pyruvate formate lyase activating enzyme